jgi:hypothetical protein
MRDALLFAALTVAFIIAAAGATTALVRHYRRRDDLMALAHAVRPRCTHIGRASEPDHLWHACDLHPRHTDVDPMHHCGREACGGYWRTPLHEIQLIQALDALYADASEPDRRH